MDETAPLSFQGSLPIPRTRLIGREDERVAARTFLLDEAVALLTLTGPGGVGKTRLSLAIATDAADHFADGVVWVDLAAITDPGLVPAAVATALAVTDTADRSIIESLVGDLRSKHLLLLVDNCEHLLHAAGDLVATLLGACPAVQVLATSRAPLHIQGEQEFSVPPLALPRSGSARTDDLAQVASVALFLQRTRAVNHMFVPAEDDLRIIAEICQRLDGLPLAIELAAARIKVLSPRALLARLSQQWQLLSSDRHDVPDRQVTLWATIAWSYELLTPEEQALFRRLAVFAGGFVPEAVQVVASAARVDEDENGPDFLFHTLVSLVDKNLLQRIEQANDEPRYGMLETIREFALRRLVECGEEAVTRERHATWCIELAEWAEAAAWTREQAQRLSRLAVDYDNVRAALAWSFDAGETAIGTRLAAAMAQYWYIRGPLSEGSDWLARALQVVESGADGSALRARVLFAAGLVAGRQQDLPRSDSLLSESLELWQASGQIRGEAEALFFLALNRELREDRGDASGSLPLFARALTFFRELDHPLEVDHPLMRHALLNLGWVTHKCGDDERALPMLEEAHALYEHRHDEWGLGISLDRLARVALDRGEAARAAMLAAVGLRTFRQQHDRAGMLDALLCVASTAAMLGNPEPAARILGAIEHLPDTIGVVPDVDFLARSKVGLAAVRAKLGRRRTADLLVMGKALSLDQAVEEALALAEELSTHVRGPVIFRDEHGGLSSREREVLRLIAAGQTNAEIAAALFIAPRTVTTHASHILNKLGLESRSELIVYAHREGLI